MNERTEELMSKQALLNSVVSNCEILSSCNNDYTPILQMRIDMLRSKIAESSLYDIEETTFEVMEFVNNFLSYRF